MSIRDICVYCREPIGSEDPIYMLGVDKPYMNLFFHREHYNLIKSDLMQYLSQNLDFCYNLWCNNGSLKGATNEHRGRKTKADEKSSAVQESQ